MVEWRNSCTFAAVNAKKRRQIASRLLLAVFLPMLLFSSLHLHPTQTLTQDECTECIHHNCGGHIGQQTASLHECVLCQFLTIPMVVAGAMASIVFHRVTKLKYALCQHKVCEKAMGIVVTRGPPAL